MNIEKRIMELSEDLNKNKLKQDIIDLLEEFYYELEEEIDKCYSLLAPRNIITEIKELKGSYLYKMQSKIENYLRYFKENSDLWELEPIEDFYEQFQTALEVVRNTGIFTPEEEEKIEEIKRRKN